MRLPYWHFLTTGAALFLASHYASAQLPENLSRAFTYNKAQLFNPDTITSFLFYHPDVTLNPLGDTSRKVQSLFHVRVTQLNYAVNDSFTSSAWITEPVVKKEGKKPVVIFQHWWEGNKDQFLSEAIEYSKRGFLCLVTDAAHRAPGSKLSSFTTQGYEITQLSVKSIQRGLDLLQEKHMLDTDNIFFIGHSYGAHLGGILTGIEPRIKAFILMAGVYSLTDAVEHSERPDFVAWREKQRADYLRWSERMKPMDPVHYLKNKRAIVYLQLPENDEHISREHYKQYEQLLLPPKKVDRYPAFHELNTKARADRYQFIMRYKNKTGKR